jgi:hypothetical protein
MARGNRFTRRCLAGAVLMGSALTVSANPYAQRDPWQPPQGQWTFAPPRQPQAATPVQNQPQYQTPAYGWPSQRTGYGQQGYYQQQYEAPYIESELSLQHPYVQQSVILKLSVISQNNLLTANPQMPQSDQYMLQLLEGPTTYSRTRKGKHEIVNDFFYELTPLRAGNLQLPAIHITGEEEQTSGYNRSPRSFDIATGQPMTLQIREANPDSRPWLPMEQLTLKVGLPTARKAAAGKPMQVTIELNAQGIGGNQLPSLEAQLRSDAFRVYREHSEFTTRLNRNSNKILGRRLERFTLVPQYGGELKLPELQVKWWNTRSDMAQRTSFPLQPIAVSGARKASGGFFASDEKSSIFMSGSSAAFWIPLAVAFGVIFGYWLAIWIAHRRKGGSQTSPLQPLVSFLQRPMHQMAPAFSPLKERLRTTGRILNPITRWHRWRRHLVGMLPLSVRFWFCVRFVDEEDDPEIWGYTLRFLANKHMELPINAPFNAIGKHILDFHPKAEPQKIHSLIHELEESVYGHHAIDFERWKEAFKHEIRPSIRLWPRRSPSQRARRKACLPGLNPGSVARS